MKARLKTQITIAAKPEDIFKYIKDLRYHYLWNPQIRTIKPEIVLSLGAEYKTTSMVLGKNLSAVNVVTAFDENRELELVNTTGMVHYLANLTLLPKANTTVVVCRTTVESKSRAFAFARPVLEVLARRELQSDLQALKLAVEQHLQP